MNYKMGLQYADMHRTLIQLLTVFKILLEYIGKIITLNFFLKMTQFLQ